MNSSNDPVLYQFDSSQPKEENVIVVQTRDYGLGTNEFDAAKDVFKGNEFVDDAARMDPSIRLELKTSKACHFLPGTEDPLYFIDRGSKLDCNLFLPPFANGNKDNTRTVIIFPARLDPSCRGDPVNACHNHAKQPDRARVEIRDFHAKLNPDSGRSYIEKVFPGDDFSTHTLKNFIIEFRCVNSWKSPGKNSNDLELRVYVVDQTKDFHMVRYNTIKIKVVAPTTSKRTFKKWENSTKNSLKRSRPEEDSSSPSVVVIQQQQQQEDDSYPQGRLSQLQPNRHMFMTPPSSPATTEDLMREEQEPQPEVVIGGKKFRTIELQLPDDECFEENLNVLTLMAKTFQRIPVQSPQVVVETIVTSEDDIEERQSRRSQRQKLTN